MKMRTHETHEDQRTELSLWYCNGCEAVHILVDGFRLSFNRTEFTALTRMVLETHCTGWPAESARTLAANQIDIDAKEITASIEYTH